MAIGELYRGLEPTDILILMRSECALGFEFSNLGKIVFFQYF
ncbi:hypothetical protein PS928_03578 [Pseudomonas fluorescens]|uniref:Uncharacterized protein n=1 Tax=Pseudomonas fluorescens TaxID=294 RepID=A0A5E7UI18_PSEFL|nr:hypothetical protein PS928_03578 [Pseudomonas fluorescens]